MKPDADKLMAYLYGELNDTEKKQFEAELAQSQDLRNELAELRGTRTMLSEWTDEAPLPLRPLHPKRTLVLNAWWFAAGLAASFLVLATAAIIAGAQVSYSGKGIGITLGSVGDRYVDQQMLQQTLDSLRAAQAPASTTIPATQVKQENPVSDEAMERMMKMTREENRKSMQDLLMAVQRNNDKQLDATMSMFATYLQQQRKTDIQTISSELERMKRVSDDKFYETDQALSKLFHTVQYPAR